MSSTVKDWGIRDLVFMPPYPEARHAVDLGLPAKHWRLHFHARVLSTRAMTLTHTTLNREGGYPSNGKLVMALTNDGSRYEVDLARTGKAMSSPSVCFITGCVQLFGIECPFLPDQS